MEPYSDSSPALWFQPPIATNLPHPRRPPIDPVFLIILVPLLALLFLLFFLPPFLTHASHILNPGGSVKSTWDSLNMFLVLFAILCGLMGRKNNDDSSFVAESSDSTVESSGEWVGCIDVDMYYNPSKQMEPPRSEEDGEEEEDVKEIHVDTFVVPSNAPEQPRPSYHSFRSVGKEDNVPTNIESYDELSKVRCYPPHHKHKTLERKVSDAATKAISSLFHHSKRKAKGKSRNTTTTTTSIRSAPTEEPPPSLFQNLFKKHKRSHSSTVPPSIFNNIFKSGKRFHLPSPPPAYSSSIIINNKLLTKGFSPPPLPPPVKSKQLEPNGKPSSCHESGSPPLVATPPPPPPPFKVSDMKFELLRGDFVKIQSTDSSVCSSPEHEGGDVNYGVICFPSTDVDAKADSFISRLKHEWRMEKDKSC